MLPKRSIEGGNIKPTADVNFAEGGAEAWRVVYYRELTVHVISKVMQVPALPENFQEWHILWVYVEFISSGTVNNRQLRVQVLDSLGNVIATLARAGAVQAAGLTRYYLFAPGVADLLAFRDTDYLTTPIPVTSILKGGEQLRIIESNNVDAAADHMLVHVQYAYRILNSMRV